MDRYTLVSGIKIVCFILTMVSVCSLGMCSYSNYMTLLVIIMLVNFLKLVNFVQIFCITHHFYR
jgi:hypothetical protein